MEVESRHFVHGRCDPTSSISIFRSLYRIQPRYVVYSLMVLRPDNTWRMLLGPGPGAAYPRRGTISANQ